MANAGARPKLFADGPRRITLALQGGGAHGAFTWGVLDRLLEEEGLEIAAISGCSAGALNGAALKSGWAMGGREGARATLDWLWEQMGAIPDLSFGQWLMTFLPGPAMTAKMLEAMFPFPVFEAMTTAISPYDLPFWENPLQKVVDQFAWDKVCAREGPRFFVSATNVRTGKVRVFSDGEIDTRVILASACLPNLFKAIEIEDPATGTTEAYWDGGYAGNPALFPLYDRDLPDDLVIVNINPLVREAVPTTAQEISNRINEISFNSSLLRELRAIGFVKRLLAEGVIAKGAMKDVRVHMIADDALMQSLSAMTKLLPTPSLLAQLKAAGREAAGRFLQQDAARIGESASVDIVKMFT
ncbi:patatin-like phospholipase family protein [Frigidibacter sp. MR17.24]|uniref:patatin-like phospholipase family protein n=1 Tax=Frigidibacter sp. MR17.24 TaxID=3127345 RepID=UPI003013124B